MTETTNAWITDPGGPERPALRPRARTLRVISAVLVVVLVLAVAAAAWFGLKARADQDAQKERADAANVASQFALRMDKVDGSAFDNYIKAVNELLTTNAMAKNTPGLRRDEAELRDRQGQGSRPSAADGGR